MWKIIAGTTGFLLCDAAMATGLEPLIATVGSWLSSTAGTAIAASATSAAIGGLMGKKAAGSIVKPKTMPTMDNEAIQAAKRRQIANMQAGSSRASTILSEDNAKLGG